MTIKSTILSCIAALSCFCAFAQETMRLQGTVYDELGEALPGAVVTVKASASDTKPKASSVADIDGHYAIPCRPGDIIEVHFLGYEVPVLTVGKSSTLNFNLEPARSRQLDEAVVIGYGSVKAADITGSITNVKMADLRDAPVTNIDAALQGRIAGADIMSTTGEPGATTSIRIRGTRSITAGNEPLIVVDGVMDAISDLNDLNPDDVESISVLKDASSTAIYGSRGSNGVILVTTKAGTVSQTSGKPYITLKLEAGVSTLPRKLDIMNAKEFANFRNEYQVGQSASLDWNVPVSELVASDPASYGKGTDWIGEITRPAPYQNCFLSVSGGKGPTKYYASFGYTDERGIIRASGQNRFSGNFSASHRILKWLEAGYKTNFNRRKIDATLASVGGTAYYNAAMYLSPLIGPHDNFNPLYGSGQRINTPVSLIEQNQNYALQTSSTQTAWADATLLKDLKWRTQVSWWTLARETYRYYPSTLPKKTEGEGGEAYRATSPQGSLNAESTVSYKKDWQKKYHLDAMAGLTWYQSHFENFGLSGSGYLNDEVTWNNMGAVTDKNTYKASSSYSFKKKLSVVGRVNFNINKKFYFTLSGRADGASNFAASRKWGFFPSAAFKWNINDALALKLSAGRTGNDAISAYMSMSAMYASNDGYLFGGTQPAAYYISRLDSPDLTWETTDLYNAALTGSYFNNRLNFTAEVYYSRTTDLLLQVNTAAACNLKGKLFWCIEDRLAALRALGVELRFGVEADAERIRQLQPYAVIVAVGASPLLPSSIRGLELPQVHTAPEIIHRRTVLRGERVLVAGSGMTGLETAEILNETGNQVTILEMADEIAPGTWFQLLDDELERLEPYGTKFLISHQLLSIAPGEVVAADLKTGKLVHIPADSVVLSFGVRPERALAAELSKVFPRVYSVGDAVRSGTIADAVKSAYEVCKGIV